METQQDSLLKIPYSKEAESYILGSIMIDTNLAEEYCGLLSVDDFYLDIHKKIYSAILSLYDNRKEVDVASVIEKLKAQNTYDAVGGEAQLFEIIDSVPSSISSGVYVEILKEKRLRRELYYRSQEIARRVIAGKDELGDLLAVSEKTITELVNKQSVSPIKRASVATEKVFEIIESNRGHEEGELIGLDTGFDELNEYTYGFQPGELIILAARPGVGKSAFALNIAQKMAKNINAHVAFFSLEMSMEQLIMRILSTLSNVKLGKIRTGKMTEVEMARLLNAKTVIEDLNIYLDETTTNRFEDIKVKCRKLKREGRLDFVVIDYLQLLSISGKSNRYEEVSTLSRSLKLLARELEVPVLALSQLSRAVEQRKAEDGSRKPMLSDLRESGSIEQDADMVLFLHREGSNGEDATKKFVNAKTELIIAKNRQGMTGSFDLIFRGEYSSFESKKKEE